MNHWSVLRFHQVAWLGGRRCVTTKLLHGDWPSGALLNKGRDSPRVHDPRRETAPKKEATESCHNLILVKGIPSLCCTYSAC